MRDLLGRPAVAPGDSYRAAAVAHILGLTPLERAKAPCCRFANGCVCADCVERAEHPDVKPRRIRQPWEPEPLGEAA